MKKKLFMSLLAGRVLLGGVRIVPAASLETEIQEEVDHAGINCRESRDRRAGDCGV